MKLLLSLLILSLPLFAKADLTCQGYNMAGEKIPLTVSMDITPQRSGLSQDFSGVPVGVGGGTTVIKAAGQPDTSFFTTYTFDDAQTRCLAGATITTTSSELNFDLYKFNPCSHTPVDSLQADYKGTLTLNEPDGAQTVFLTCSAVAEPKPLHYVCGDYGIGQLCHGKCLSSRAQCDE